MLKVDITTSGNGLQIIESIGSGVKNLKEIDIKESRKQEVKGVDTERKGSRECRKWISECWEITGKYRVQGV